MKPFLLVVPTVLGFSSKRKTQHGGDHAVESSHQYALMDRSAPSLAKISATGGNPAPNTVRKPTPTGNSNDQNIGGMAPNGAKLGRIRDLEQLVGSRFGPKSAILD